MNHKLIYYPDDTLRAKTQEVREFSADLASLANDMRTIMKENNGMGLAAIQVGDLRRLIIVEYPGDEESGEKPIPFTVLINPKITKAGRNSDVVNEGCLSVLNVEVPIERSIEVTVLAQSLTGEPLRIRAKGIYARILQHEIDHLNGVLIVDYAKKAPKSANTIKTMVWGSTSFTTQLLNTLAGNPDLTITHLVTEAPKPSGRGREVQPTIVRMYADTLGLPCLEPTDLHDERLLTYLKGSSPDLIIVAAYGKLLPSEVLAIPKYGCINVHPSLLPRHRGATPIQSAILAGDSKTGVSIIAMSPEFDTGNILATSEIDLNGTETYGSLEPLMAELGGEMIETILPDHISGNLQSVPQNNELATPTRKIKTQDRWLNPADSPQINERKVRAFAPQPGAFVILGGQLMKVLAAHIEYDELHFDTVQPAGKKVMAWEAFKRGYNKPLVFEEYTTS